MEPPTQKHTQTHTQTFLLPSPTSSSSSSNKTNNTNIVVNNNNSNNNNGATVTTPKQPQTPVTRSETNPYPTTFVQADTSSFKQVVQMLTGSSEPTPKSSKPGNPIPPIKTPNKSKPSKLYERRSTSLKNLRLNTPFSHHRNNNNNGEILSPSLLDFPSLVLSPVTPLNQDPFNRSPISSSSSPSPNITSVNKSAEDKAIADKAFFLHPSPVSTPRDSEPRLLTLFPLTSPRSDPTS